MSAYANERDPTPEVAPEAAHRKRWPWRQILVGVTAGVLAVGGSLALVAYLDRPTALANASAACSHAGQLADSDTTLVLDMRGEDDGSGILSITDVACILNALDVPSYITTEMDKTRALDGRQSATWAGFEASWTYHPDQGLDVIIRQVSV